MTDDRMDPFVWHNFGCVFPLGHKVNECCGGELLDYRQQGNSPGPSLTILGVLKSL